MRKNPFVQRALAAGEERMGKVVSQILSGEGLAARVQSLVSSARSAREVLERGVRGALSAANLPRGDDVEDLKRRLGELEQMVDDLGARLERSGGGRDGAAGPAGGRDRSRP